MSIFSTDFNNQSFLNAIGNLGINLFCNNPYIANISEFEKEEDWISASEVNLQALQFFFLCLWFVKDNSCNISELYVFPEKGEIISRRRNTFFSNSEGLYKDYSFNGEEFKEAAFFYQKVVEISTNSIENSSTSLNEIGGYVTSAYNNKKYNSNNRIERANNFLLLARSTSFLPEKISFYILVLECIFSADDMGEIQHKISERVAFYIGDTSVEKSQLFNDIKQFYKLRSKYLHGQQLEKKHNEPIFQKEMSIKLDNIIRRVMRRVISKDHSIFLLDVDPLRDWFNKLLFT